MKKAGVAGRGVTLKLKASEFRTVTRARRLHGATRSAEEMFRAAEPLLPTRPTAAKAIAFQVNDAPGTTDPGLPTFPVP